MALNRFAPVYTNFIGTGAGGGLFFGTRTFSAESETPVLGFFTTAPTIWLRNATAPPLNTVLQWSSLTSAFDPTTADVAVTYARKVAVTVFNLYPSNLSPSQGPPLWSTLTVFTSPTTFEVFALVWTQPASYVFFGCNSAFELVDGKVRSTGQTSLILQVTAVAPVPDAGAPGCYSTALPAPSPFYATALLSTGQLPLSARSSALTNFVLGAT